MAICIITYGPRLSSLQSFSLAARSGWAEPLLWMISENYRTVPFPLLDMIMANDLTYIPRDSSPHGVFSIGNLIFGWAQLRRSHLVKTDPKP